ncbi:3-oxoadipyl-CoA thiolase [Telmatospirillum siberiense]|uniref:3-oxoadipyl-CoA thiolase n=1 Tax=Telmatospirillum siberiense TaxID=382514 RepID=A0A2N3PUU1_9PROT|nr:3-oxoadipyl-CoA thiolase [Telmatospirillum siberiense]PKU24167.1 3-oxoadipyl-CoA thiolase [Telmatospirillum siberiense]
MSEAFVCDAVRTPIGRHGGALATVRPDDLAAVPLRALMARTPGADWSRLDEVYLGCANQAGEDNRDVARMALLLADFPVEIPGVTVNRLCGSGLEAVGGAARAIVAGEIDFAIAGGVESMSRAPFVLPKTEQAFSRAAVLEDTTVGWRLVNPLMRARYGTDSMPETAENVAAEFEISRGDQDAFALRSQNRAALAAEAGILAEQIVPVVVARKGGASLISVDEQPRPDSSPEGLAALRTPFRSPGTVTAGNAAGINDGAAALVIASERAVREHDLRPRARILGMATAGVVPRLMGIGPVPASRKLLARLGLGFDDFDVIEINEAFAAQALACLRDFGIADDSSRVNPYGGAIALGHPLGMSGARLVLSAVQYLEKSGGRRALTTMCIGVGQGIALALERV